MLLDLSGQRFHKLKARKFSGKRNKRGRRLWLCDCECGGTKLVATDDLTSDHVKSCGCLHRQSGRRTRFTKAKRLAAYQKRERQKAHREWWLAPGRADRYLGVYRSTRLLWAKSCPWRGGKGIRTRPLIDGFGRELDFYAEKDCQEILDNKANYCAKVPKDHTHVNDACEKIGISLGQLEIEMRDADVKTKRQRGKSKDGRARLHSYVPDWFVDKLLAERTPDLSGFAVREVAKSLGISIAAVYSAIRRNLLKASPGRPNCKTGYKRKGPIIAPDEVERYRAYRAGEAMPAAAHVTHPPALPRVVGLSQTEEEIVTAARLKGPLHGDGLAAAAGYNFNSHFRNLVSKLCKLGLLVKTPDGYIAGTS
jgi:hypothetical protein